MHTPAMQRLYGLKQLGLSDRIFIDASHSRIHHVVGVLRQVDKLVSAIDHNLRRRGGELRISSSNGETRVFQAEEFAQVVRKRKPVIRFIGLLHDLTHAPFGHTIEDEIQLLESKHDHPERQAESFYRLICQLSAWLCVEAHGPRWEQLSESLHPFLSHDAHSPVPPPAEVARVIKSLIESLTKSKEKLCLKLSQKEIAEMYASLHCAMTSLLHLQVLHEPVPTKADIPEDTEYPFQEAIRRALDGTKFAHLLSECKFDPQRDAYMLDVVGNTVCADLLDYAQRDSHFAGLRLDYDSDRIAENFTIVPIDASAYELNHPGPSGGIRTTRQGNDHPRSPFEGWCLRAAISLVSHKYRTDIPGELMNLLNVRFYLYERVIYHPTKCAAGSMLGTALQLLGLRKTPSGGDPTLPIPLRHVGDDVFIHEVSAALTRAIDLLEAQPKNSAVGENQLDSRLARGGGGEELAALALEARKGEAVSEALHELRAAQLLLNRLKSRRYFRPVFRALPSTKDATLQAGADALANTFRNPGKRYDAEREIEKRAGLPRGTITIHCPTRHPARKIANVFLTRPDSAGDDPVCKLKDIASLDREIFGEHENAVKAVERMYGSMWRLTVYVAPEHLEDWEMISDIAGRVIFEAVDVHQHFSDRNDRKWSNDPNLRLEMEGKLGASIGDTGGEEDLHSFGERLGQICDELRDSGQLSSIQHELYTSEDGVSAEGRKRFEEALIAAFAHNRSPAKAQRDTSLPRAEQVITVIKGYIKRIDREDIEGFTVAYGTRLNALTAEKFDGVLSRLEAAVNESNKVDGRGVQHRGAKFKQFTELLNLLLEDPNDRTSPEPAGGLFGAA